MLVKDKTTIRSNFHIGIEGKESQMTRRLVLLNKASRDHNSRSGLMVTQLSLKYTTPSFSSLVKLLESVLIGYRNQIYIKKRKRLCHLTVSSRFFQLRDA